jgi:N,N-dimethylformamidase
MPVGQRYPILPLPHVPEQTEMIAAGVLTIGVGHRVLDEATARAYNDWLVEFCRRDPARLRPVTAVSLADPAAALAEARRGHGTRSWTAAPGELHLSLTGEAGGLWRDRGRAPQRHVGVGFAAMGFDHGRPYRRTPQSHDPRASFIFEGVEDELIGDFPGRVSGYGAAGFEIDRADVALGTPPHALIVATASGFSNGYQNAVEEAQGMQPTYGGQTCPNVRADMVFYETPNHGAVFSTGSVAWCGALSHQGFDNSVSRVMENVVRAFIREGPLPRDPGAAIG